MRLRDTATILRGTAGDAAYAGETGEVDWTTPTETVVACSIQPGTSQERGQDRPDFVVADWVGYFPAGTDLTAADRVAWRGRTFTVDGEVAPWVHGASEHHLEVPLKRVGEIAVVPSAPAPAPAGFGLGIYGTGVYGK